MYELLRAKSLTFLMRICICVAISLTAASSYAADQDEFVGIYSMMSPYLNKQVDVVKIEKANSNYVVSINQAYSGIEWSEPEPGRLLTADQKKSYASMFGNAKFDESSTGLETDATVIFKLKKGWQSRLFQTNTDYLWISRLGAFEVSRRPLEQHN